MINAFFMLQAIAAEPTNYGSAIASLEKSGHCREAIEISSRWIAESNGQAPEAYLARARARICAAGPDATVESAAVYVPNVDYRELQSHLKAALEDLDSYAAATTDTGTVAMARGQLHATLALIEGHVARQNHEAELEFAKQQELERRERERAADAAALERRRQYFAPFERRRNGARAVTVMACLVGATGMGVGLVQEALVRKEATTGWHSTDWLSKRQQISNASYVSGYIGISLTGIGGTLWLIAHRELKQAASEYE